MSILGRIGSALKGGLGGGLAGFALGGPVGGLVGAAGGGLLGGVGSQGSAGGLSDEQKRMYADYYRQVQERGAPQLGPASTATNSDLRGNQLGLIGQLEATASGRGPSLAAEQLKAATDRNTRNQQAFAASAPASQAGLARFQAQNNVGTLGAQAAQDAAAARIAEITAAQNQLGLTLHGARGADEATSKFNADQQNQMARANLEAQLRARGLDDEAIARYMGTGASTPGTPSTADTILAGGAQAFGALSNMRAGQTAKTPAYAGSDYSRTYGDDTMNPFASAGAPKRSVV